MQKSGFPKMHHYVGFWQIGSPICILLDNKNAATVTKTNVTCGTTVLKL